MEHAAGIAIAVTIFGALCASWGLLLPFFAPAEPIASNESDLQSHREKELIRRREQVFGALEDLEQQFLSGTLPEDYYTTSKAELTSEVATIIHELERGEERVNAPSPS